MVLEIILNPRKAESFSHVLLLSFVYTIISVLVANQLFPQQASILAIALITILFIPFFQGKFEQEEEREKQKNLTIFSRHKEIISLFSAFFMGIVIASSFVFTFLPFQNAFQLQASTLQGSATSPDSFLKIILNNTQVMVLMFIFSMAFGAGAIFILAWNASVVAVYAGTIAKSIGVPLPFAFLLGAPAALGSIALHGIPEILAYFIAGLAGGILSYGVVKEKLHSKEFRQIFSDALSYLLIAEFLVVIAGLLEAAV